MKNTFKCSLTETGVLVGYKHLSD